jgi:hypothetical protein
MDKSKEISFNHASIFSGDSSVLHDKDWRKDYKVGKYYLLGAGFDVAIDDTYLLEMRDIQIPLDSQDNFKFKKDAIESARRLVGNFGKNLEKYTDLVKKGIVQECLYFEPGFLQDGSSGEKDTIGHQKLGKTVYEARKIKIDLEHLSSKGIKIGKVPEIRYRHTFQAIRDLDFVEKDRKDFYRISGATFSDMLNNFLVMYDTVVADVNFVKGEEIRKWREAKKEGKTLSQKERRVPIGELVWE